MWLIRYHVVPKPNSPEFQKSGGAYVNCWILYAWQDGAEYLAKFEVEKEWIITETDEISWVELDDFDDEEDREYFLQAQIDGGCFVYHHYPLNAEDIDEDFELENSTTNNQKIIRTEH
jgi:hypothetical protein